MSGLVWKPKAAFNLTILSGRSYSEQGGFTWKHAQRNNGNQFILNEVLDASEVGVDFLWGYNNPAQLPGTLLPGSVIQIEDEKMLVTSVSGLTATVTRAYAGTTGATHATGLTITVTTTGDGAIDMTGISWMSILFPTAWTAADLAFFACATRDGTYIPMRDETGVLLSITGIATAAANSQYCPGKVNAGGPYVKVRSITVGTDPTSAVTQAADRLLVVAFGE